MGFLALAARSRAIVSPRLVISSVRLRCCCRSRKKLINSTVKTTSEVMSNPSLNFRECHNFFLFSSAILLLRCDPSGMFHECNEVILERQEQVSLANANPTRTPACHGRRFLPDL